MQTGQKGQYVFVVRPDLTAEYRPVVAGDAWSDEIEIEKGVQPGENVVTDGQLRLSDGRHVRIVEGVDSDGRPGAHEHSRALHPPARDDHADHGGHPPVRRRRPTACCRSASLPNVDFPTLQVTAALPGASPETMASSVATPLERQFSTIAGVWTR